MHAHSHHKKCLQKEKRSLLFFFVFFGVSVMLCYQVAVCVSVQLFTLEPNSIKPDVSILLPVTFQTSHRFPCYFCFTSLRFILWNAIPPLTEGGKAKETPCYHYKMIEIVLLFHRPKGNFFFPYETAGALKETLGWR